jgi:hypothetical protein
MSTRDDFRSGIEAFLKEITDLLKELRREFRRLPPADDEARQRAADWANDVDITLSFNLRDAEHLLDIVPVTPPELRAIRDQILRIPIVESFRSRALDWYECHRDLPILEARLREMLEYIPESALASAIPTGPTRKSRGPHADTAKHEKIAEVAAPHGADWKHEKNLDQIVEKLDRARVPVSKSWPKRKPSARTWKTAVIYFPQDVVKAIDYSLQMTKRKNQPPEDCNSRNSR